MWPSQSRPGSHHSADHGLGMGWPKGPPSVDQTHASINQDLSWSQDKTSGGLCMPFQKWWGCTSEPQHGLQWWESVSDIPDFNPLLAEWELRVYKDLHFLLSTFSSPWQLRKFKRKDQWAESGRPKWLVPDHVTSNSSTLEWSLDILTLILVTSILHILLQLVPGFVAQK